MEIERRKTINIIDPSSTEFNRGSFCYSPYLCYNGLKEIGHHVSLYEVFRPEDLDSIKDADIQIISLWSYPQIETCRLLSLFLPFAYGKDNVYFVGFSPLIHSLGLRHIETLFEYDPMQTEMFLSVAMASYPKYYSHFKRLLLSDCDMHLKHIEHGELVHPLFTTYGCPNGCSFCPSTENCGRKRIVLHLESTKQALDECEKQQIKHIHFTDEDMFYDIDRLYEILKYLKGKGFRMIALGSAKKVEQFIDKYGTEIFKDSGLEIVEIGFESASAQLSEDMGAGKSFNSCTRLARIQHKLPFHIFWLVQTFFPGETIVSLNETGRFMKEYGFGMNEVVGRLRTNGTVGGLGQFFQPYHGLKIFNELQNNGDFITSRPVRLLPSFIPNSFINSEIKKVNLSNLIYAGQWLKVYNIELSEAEIKSLKPGVSINHFYYARNETEKIRIVILFAILARMEVIQ